MPVKRKKTEIELFSQPTAFAREHVQIMKHWAPGHGHVKGHPSFTEMRPPDWKRHKITTNKAAGTFGVVLCLFVVVWHLSVEVIYLENYIWTIRFLKNNYINLFKTDMFFN